MPLPIVKTIFYATCLAYNRGALGGIRTLSLLIRSQHVMLSTQKISKFCQHRVLCGLDYQLGKEKKA